jgi:butyryl-CoA dehydrogenase
MAIDQYVDPRDIFFWLYEVGDAARLAGEDIDREGVTDMLDTVSRLAESEFDGLAHLLDENEPRLVQGRVVNPPELAKALRAYIDLGLPSATFPPEVGGMGMPVSIAMALRLPVDAMASSTVGYLFLTAAAANMLSAVGDESLKAVYLEPMVTMRWFGTMMLSETEAGSSLGDIRCNAVRQPDGSYHLSGSKMWVSGADHDLAENIVHMVLAKVASDHGAVPGSAGISLFLVPKYLVNDDGSLGDRNGITIAGLNHKMGQRGIVNTVPVLGEDRPCIGYLVGEEGRGLAGMFHMMNEARVAIGFAAAVTGYAGYRYSLAYARQRTQGRPLTDPDPAKPPVSIIRHPDVRRMLLAQKAYAEGGLALCLYAAEIVDRIRTDPGDRSRLDDLLAVLTPMVKTWPSTWCLHANHLAIQVMGGYGYTRDFPVERMYRDNRLNEIHEGTTGIQSLDLLGRKVLRDGGAALGSWIGEMLSTAAEAAGEEVLAEYGAALSAAARRVEETAAALGAEAAAGRIERAMANSVVFLDMCGHVAVAWMWLRMALVAARNLPSSAETERPFYHGKLAACRFFYRWELPKTEAQADLLIGLETTPLEVAEDEF